jgi:predicted RNA-binding protein YlqC (UPF0109 family)
MTDTTLQKIVSQFVQYPEDVKVIKSDAEDGSTLLTLTVNQEDMGRVIGKNGKIARALRLMLRVPAHKTGERINLEIADQVNS